MNSSWIDPTPLTDAALATETPDSDLLDQEKKKLAREQRENLKLEKRLCRQVGQAIVDYNMIEEGDRVMVCGSGGKDSYGLLDILLNLQQRMGQASFGDWLTPMVDELVKSGAAQREDGWLINA